MNAATVRNVRRKKQNKRIGDKNMKTLNYLMEILTVSACLLSCADNGEGIGSPLKISKDYNLPQSGASEAANRRILNYYDKYGSFVLYDFTNKDAMWVMSTGNASKGGREYFTTLGDPTNVDTMLDYIEDIWLKYFSEDFLKKGGMPYRVFLADSLYMQRDFGESGGIVKYPTNYMINGDAVIIAGMNVISELTEAEKKSRKVELFNALWNYYKGKGLVDNPEEFYAGTDYITPPHMSYDEVGREWIYTDEDLDALRNRGFIPDYNAYGYTKYSEIFMQYSETNTSWSNTDGATIKANDYKYYLNQIIQATDEEATEFLKYPAVATKWNFLVNHYKEAVGIDLRALGK